MKIPSYQLAFPAMTVAATVLSLLPHVTSSSSSSYSNVYQETGTDFVLVMPPTENKYYSTKRRSILKRFVSPQKRFQIHLSHNSVDNQNDETITTKKSVLDISTNIPRGGGGDDVVDDSIIGAAEQAVIEFLNIIDVFGTALFAFSGALTAGRKGMDLLGMAIIAMITATGGGTVRDLLVNRGPVFWLQNAMYTKICVTMTLFTFFVWPKLEQQFGMKDSALPICYADALCLGAFAVVGTQKAVDLDLDPVLWIVFGLLTSVFGGVTRDILCLQRPRVLYPERTPYGGPPLLGSIVYALLIRQCNMNGRLAACISIFVTFTTRVLSFNSSRRLPHWKLPTE